MKTSLPLGVDIVEWKKAASFYKRHHERLDDILTEREKRFVQRTARPQRAFAMVYAAKEAAFKALGLGWMGVGGFRRLSLLPSGKRPFRIQRHSGLGVSFVKSRRHVIACCHPL